MFYIFDSKISMNQNNTYKQRYFFLKYKITTVKKTIWKTKQQDTPRSTMKFPLSKAFIFILMDFLKWDCRPVSLKMYILSQKYTGNSMVVVATKDNKSTRKHPKFHSHREQNHSNDLNITWV